MKHDWQLNGFLRQCVNCTAFLTHDTVRMECFGPQPTPEPHLAAAYGEMDGAWDRLRADLANLGVDAPAMAPQSPLTAVDVPAWILSYEEGPCHTEPDCDATECPALAVAMSVPLPHETSMRDRLMPYRGRSDN